ncbi:MAG: AAA family ATPase [Candidatus Thermoplasmatota archaeon]|nr:AAA family ATPase [Candidatus Thermoplasmatota archaeon]
MNNGSSLTNIPDQPVFVNRADEKDTIVRYLRSAINKRGGMVLVEGEAGIGKTRFIDECTKLAREMGFLVMSGRCFDNREYPYQPFIEMIKDHFEIGKKDLERSDINRIAERIQHELPMVGGYRYDLIELLLPRNERSTYSGSDPSQDQSRFPFPVREEEGEEGTDAKRTGISIYELLPILFEEISEHQPTLMVLEDLQWSEKATQNLIQFLSRDARREHLLILGSYRSEGSSVENDPEGPISLGDTLRRMSREHLYITLTLDRFDQARSMLLAAALLGHGMDLKDTGTMMRETGGNPRLIIDFIKRTTELELPISTHTRPPLNLADGQVGNRISSLGDEARSVLEMAAVLGEGITVERLSSLLEIDLDGVLDALDTLMDMRFLKEGGDHFFFEQPGVKELILEGIPGETRKKMHLKVAGLLELPDNLQDKDTGYDLALHLYYGGDLEKALPALIERCIGSLRDGDLDNALSVLDLLDDCIDRSDDNEVTGRIRIETLQLRGDVQDARGNIEESMVSYRKAIEYTEKSGLSRFSARNNRRMGDLLLKRFEWDATVEHYLRSLQLSKKMGDEEETALSFKGLGSIYLHKGDYSRSIECYIKYLEFTGTRTGIDHVRGLVEIGDIYFQIGDFNQALAYYKLAIQKGEDGRLSNEASLAHVKMACVLLKLGEVEEAKRYGDIIQSRVQSREPSKVAIEVMLLNADLMLELGEVEKADEIMHDLEGSIDGMDRLLRSIAYRVKGMLLSLQRDFKGSNLQMKAAVSTLEEIDAPYHLAVTYFNFGLIRFQQMDVESALEMLKKASDIFKRIRSMYYINRTFSKIREVSFIREDLRT